MKSTRFKFTPCLGFVLALCVCFALTGCMTGYGGASRGGYSQSQAGDVYITLIGTVQRIDRIDHKIVLTVRDRRGYYDRGTQTVVAYNQGTRLQYQSRIVPVANLERGDVIRIDAQRSPHRLLAYSIDVLRNVRNVYGEERHGQRTIVSGTVLHVDPYAQVISLNASYGGRSQIRYTDGTVVEYAGRRYWPRNLERGDLIRVQLQLYGKQWFAAHIQVVRDATR